MAQEPNRNRNRRNRQNRFPQKIRRRNRNRRNRFWGVAKGSSISWVAKFKGDENSECKLSNGWSRSYREIEPLLFRMNLRNVIFYLFERLDKTKTLQTVTLRVAILSDFSATRLSQNFGAKLRRNRNRRNRFPQNL